MLRYHAQEENSAANLEMELNQISLLLINVWEASESNRVNFSVNGESLLLKQLNTGGVFAENFDGTYPSSNSHLFTYLMDGSVGGIKLVDKIDISDEIKNTLRIKNGIYWFENLRTHVLSYSLLAIDSYKCDDFIKALSEHEKREEHWSSIKNLLPRNNDNAYRYLEPERILYIEPIHEQRNYYLPHCIEHLYRKPNGIAKMVDVYAYRLSFRFAQTVGTNLAINRTGPLKITEFPDQDCERYHLPIAATDAAQCFGYQCDNKVG